MAESIVHERPKQTRPSHPPMFDQPHPYLLLTHGPMHHRMQTFYSVSEGRYITTKSIPELAKKFVCHCFGTEWMFLEEFGSHKSCLYNIITEQKVDLPPFVDAHDSTACCIVTSTPTNSDCRVHFFGGHHDLITCKVGDSSFVTRTFNFEYLGFGLASMIKGKIYGMICHTRELVVADDLNDPSHFSELGITPHPEIERGNSGYLIDFFGKILLVQKVELKRFSEDRVVVSFKVFLADFSEMAWVKLGKIDNHAIFLEMYRGFTCSTNGLIGVKPNCIYFIEGKANDRKISVFDMEDESIRTILPSCKVSANRSILRWILMPASSSSHWDSTKKQITTLLIALYEKMPNLHRKK